MRSEARCISISFYFLFILLALLLLLDLASPAAILPEAALEQFWPYYSLLFALLLILLGLRFPIRRAQLRSACFLSLASFLLVFESFGLFAGHPQYSFIHIWNYAARALLQDSFASGMQLRDFLPAVMFAFWGPALLALILPAERFPLLHWLFYGIMLAFSVAHWAASLFFGSYTAGLLSSILILPALGYHGYHLLRLSRGFLSLLLFSLFQVLLLCLLALLSSSTVFFQSIFPGQSPHLYLSSSVLLPQDILRVKIFHYTVFFLWFSFPLLFQFLFPSTNEVPGKRRIKA